MNDYYELLDEAEREGIAIQDGRYFKSDADALIKGKKIRISHKIDTDVEKKCVLAEELAHYKYNVGNILNMNDPESRRQEYRGRKRMLFDLVTLDDLIAVFSQGITEKHELADHLNITEKVIDEAIAMYKKHYGTNAVMHKGYLIQFEPALEIGKALDLMVVD